LTSELSQRLAQRGWALVEDWRTFGLDIEALDEQVARTLALLGEKKTLKSTADAQLRVDVIVDTKARYAALGPLLEAPAVHRVVTTYLGGTARFDGVSTIYHRAGNISAADSYGSGLWHHDRCGSRLKLFVFLSDVDSDSHPTQVADGTHNTLYYSNTVSESRFRNEYVRAHHQVIDLVGRRGGGFLFDTNALHRGKMAAPSAGKARAVVILEFHPHGKIPALWTRGLHAPCPSQSVAATGSGARRSGIPLGLPGYGKYPQEHPESAAVLADAKAIHMLGGDDELIAGLAGKPPAKDMRRQVGSTENPAKRSGSGSHVIKHSRAAGGKVKESRNRAHTR